LHLVSQLLFPQATVFFSPVPDAIAPVAGFIRVVLVIEHAEPGSRRPAPVSFQARRLVLVVELSGAAHQTMLVHDPCRVQYPSTRIE
jgi:hypothetical protein